MPTLTLAERKQRIADKMLRDKAKLRALTSKESDVARKLETRAKILIGAAYLEHAKKHPDQRNQVETVLRQLITKDRDIEVLRAFGFMRANT